MAIPENGRNTVILYSKDILNILRDYDFLLKHSRFAVSVFE